MKACGCPVPAESPNPRDHGCAKCGRVLDPRWTSNNETMAWFFDRLASRWAEPPPDFDAFRRHCLHREYAGRETFGHSFLARNNPQEALEEFCDGALYSVFDTLQSIRNGEEPEEDLALTAAYHAFLAYCSARQLARKHSGTP